MKKQLTIWILTLTIIGCSIVLSLLNWNNLKNLQLNELSDFYGVFVSTLVFIWLIYGYRMQADELALQREELKHQVENTKKLVEQSEFQTKSDIESIRIEKSKIKEEYIYRIRPVLVFYSTGKDDKGRSRWVLKNVGKSTAINILVSCGS